MAAPLYLEMAPPEEAAKQIDHLFVFRDTGVLSGGGRGRFVTDLPTLSETRDDSGGGAYIAGATALGFRSPPKAIPWSRGRAEAAVTTEALTRIRSVGHVGLRTGPFSDR